MANIDGDPRCRGRYARLTRKARDTRTKAKWWQAESSDYKSSSIGSQFSTHAPALLRVDEYLDASPRYGSEVIHVGNLVLFASHTPWAYYARPNPKRAAGVRRRDLTKLRRVCDQRELPLRLEWIEELSPELVGITEDLGFNVERHPLLLLTRDELVKRARSSRVRLLDREDCWLLQSRAVVHLAFDPTMGTTAGVAERDDRLPTLDHIELTYARQRARSGRTVTGVAIVDGAGVVATGSYIPIADVAEIVGVGTLPAYRRQGIGSDVVHLLCEHAFSSGAEFVTLAAENEAVVRMYLRLGYRRIGTCMSAQDR